MRCGESFGKSSHRDPVRGSARCRQPICRPCATGVNVEPRKLSQELRGELDWIVMKAMDKDRDRRYATVNDLAADVERYLHDEPVQACPPSVAYRFTKFARRNRAALVTSALVALALIVGTGVSVWQAIRATNAELAALAERDEKEQQALRATSAEQQTAQALLTAEDRLQFGRQAVDDMYTQLAEKWLAQQAELTPVQKQFLEKALAFYQRLATEESADPAVRFETAKAQQRVGEIQRKLGQHKEAEATFRQARELSPTVGAGEARRAPVPPSTRPDTQKLGRAAFLHGPVSRGRAGTAPGSGDYARPWPPSSPAKLSTRRTSRDVTRISVYCSWTQDDPARRRRPTASPSRFSNHC